MRKLINYKLLFLSPFFLAACSNEDNIPSILPSNQPDAVELGITAGVTLTKSAVTANTGLTGGIAVYAALDGTASGTDVDPYTSTLKNNYAVYTLSGSCGRYYEQDLSDFADGEDLRALPGILAYRCGTGRCGSFTDYRNGVKSNRIIEQGLCHFHDKHIRLPREEYDHNEQLFESCDKQRREDME